MFQCTEAQAEFYFFKFGKDAQIVRPLRLREKFQAMYEAAAGAYALERTAGAQEEAGEGGS